MPGQPVITHEASGVHLDIQGHQERISLDVLGVATHDIILGLPWLRKHNPRINWKKQQLSFDNCDCINTVKPTQAQSSMVDERTINEIASNRKSLKELHSARIDRPSSKVTEQKGTDEPLNIPECYKDWEYLFREETSAAALPKHQPWDHEILLQEGKQPTFGPIYGLSDKELEVLREYIQVNLKKGFIRESQSPAGYPIIFVPKKNGKLRLCVDYRKLNDITIKNRYPLPNIAELRDRLSHAQVFTALDLRGAYNLIRMKKGEEWKTAFRTRYGHYEYCVMPFGLTNAPATCQALINNVLRAHLDKFVIAYLDDILIYSNDTMEHIGHVRTVLECLAKAELRLEPNKCEFHKREVEFLGCTVGAEGVKMSEEKIKVVKDWPQPKNVKDIQSYLGFLNFNRQFIKDYSKIALPLTLLTRKDTPFVWTEAQEQAFQTLKQASIAPPTLVAFRSGEPLRFETDASDLALGACASQEREGKWHPIAYYSRKFSGPEERYDVHDKELLAVIEALRHWRIYAESCSDLVIFTDHKNLLTFTTTKALQRRHTRWCEEIGQYKFRIVYTPGKDNGRADALSRRHDIAGTKATVETAILHKNPDGSLGPMRTLNAISKTTMDVPEELQNEIIRQHHDDPVHGHPGIRRTMELIQRNYGFPRIKEKVTTYIKRCADCQRNKHDTHAPYGEMQAMELPSEPWADIAMDFVTGLPESKDPVTGVSYNGIMVNVCRFTKEAEYIPFRDSFTAVQLAHIFTDRVARYHGIPKTIISDRDKLFTSNFWSAFLASIGTKKKLSTAYHPQTDGQTERTNRTMKAYLRIYVNQQQNNWVSLLPMAQMAYNNTLSESTGLTPFYANHGRHPNLFSRTYPSIKAEAAMATAEELKETHKQMEENLRKAQKSSITHANKKRKTAPQLKEGDKVYLSTKNLRNKRPSKGLDHVKVGPFLIKSRRGPVNYVLQLPPDAKIHPVFHVSRLEPADPATPLQTNFHYRVEEDNEFEVERILDDRVDNLEFEYLVKWKGYPTSENTWEPVTNLRNCRRLLQRYLDQKRLGPRSQLTGGPPRTPRRNPQRHPRC